MNQRHLEPHALMEVVSDLPEEYLDWSITNMGLDKLPYCGDGQMVGVLDTGCDTSHPDLKPSFIRAFSAIPGETSAEDENGHGTFIASQLVAAADGRGVVGAVPKAELMSGRVLYGDGRDQRRRGMDQDIADGINRMRADGCGVISMSLGGPGTSPAIRGAVQHAVASGVIVLAAAGNEKLLGSPYASYPASYSEVISVAAADRHGLPSWFTTAAHDDTAGWQNRPEVAVASLEYYWGCLPGGGYGRMIGTSMATPALAALAVVWREAQTAKGAVLRDENVSATFRMWLQEIANDINKNGWDSELGFGTVLLDDNELENV